MANCNVNYYQAHATVVAGSLSASTPFVHSCSVNRTRGALTAKASASFTVGAGEASKAFQTGGGSVFKILIHGTVVFTGIIRKITVTPSLKCQGGLIVNVQGEDVLYLLNNRRITRRQLSSPLAPTAFITSIYEHVNQGFDNPYTRHDISRTGSSITTVANTDNIAELTQFIKNGGANTQGSQHPLTKVAEPITSGRAATAGTGFILHDHSSLDLTGPHAGGPAVAVFGVK